MSRKTQHKQRKGTPKNKEKEHNPWAPKPITPSKPNREEYVELERNLLSLDAFGGTNSEIDIRENNESHCLLLIYNFPFIQDDALKTIEKSASHIQNKKIRYSIELECYIIECSF